MTASALLKKVMAVYPEAFEDLSQPKLRLVKEAVLYASKVSATQDTLESDDHKNLISSLSGKDALSPGDKLKAYRLRADLSQVSLSKKAGVSQSNIAAMEAGKRTIGLTSAKKLAKALKCDFRKLV